MNAATLGGLPSAFRFGDATYQLAAPDFQDELAFQQRHEDFALGKLEQHRRGRGEPWYREQADGLRRDLTANLYAFGTDLSLRFLCTDRGLSEYALLLMTRGCLDHGGAPADAALLDRVRADEAKWDELCKLLLGRDFPFLLTATPPPTTSAPSPS